MVGIGITRAGRWVLVEPPVIAAMAVHDGKLPELIDDTGEAMLMRGPVGSEIAVRQQSALTALGPVDVAFALLHGPFGEDGTIQGLFEMMGTRYVGVGVLASAIGMDKPVMKLVLAASGLPVGPFVSITPAEWQLDPRGAWRRSRPCSTRCSSSPPAVAPASASPRWTMLTICPPRSNWPSGTIPGSSSSRASSARASWSACSATSTEVGRWRVRSQRSGCTARRGSMTSRPSTCPRSRSAWTPADVDRELADQIREVAVRAFEVIGCEGLARVDVFVTRDRQVVINEINTMPGFTPHSMFPRMWAASGVPYPELVERLIQLAQQRPSVCADRS